MEPSQSLSILRKVQTGEVSIEEAERLLKAAGDPAVLMPAPLVVEEQGTETDPEDPLAGLGWWKNAWMIPVWAGTAILVLSAWLLTWGYTNERFFWFACSWLPLTLGMLVLILGVWSRQARWAHIRIQDADGSRISISLPLPIRVASWALRIFTPRIKTLKEKHLEMLPEILDALGNTHDPITVEVDEDSEHVRVYIQ